MKHALQVYLDDPDFRELEAWSKRRGWTLSQAVRVAIKALTRPAKEDDPLLAASGMIEGLPTDLSERLDHYLDLTFVAERPVPYGRPTRKRRPKKALRR